MSATGIEIRNDSKAGTKGPKGEAARSMAEAEGIIRGGAEGWEVEATGKTKNLGRLNFRRH